MQSSELWTVIRILEEDYGCEGVPENEEPMCRVLVQHSDGSEKWLRLPDSYLTKQNIQEGDKLNFSEISPF